MSSTYEDLIEERLEVMKALLELDCIPCGMEYFPAANEDQWTFIKKLIEACDYYVVIIGGKYGSEDHEGKSYTQKEYEYALSKEIPTIGFINRIRESLPETKRESNVQKVEKLNNFIDIVKSKLCKEWANQYELGAVVSRSLTQLMKSHPRTGWVRADRVGNEELLAEVNDLRKANQSMREQIARLETEARIETDSSNIAFEELIEVRGQYRDSLTLVHWSYKISWKDIFVIISPYLLKWHNEVTIRQQIAESVLKKMGRHYTVAESIDEDVLQSIKIQFLALGLIQLQTLNTVGGGTGLFWKLTTYGQQVMIKEGSVKKS